MGKSPGKWIKTLLSGKKSSKSSTSKGMEKYGNDSEVLVPFKSQQTGLPLGQAIVSESVPYNVGRGEVESEIEREDSNVSKEALLLPGNQDADAGNSTPQEAMDDPEKLRLGVAATHVQAAFRGYLARRAFQALKGIIRLQALIRGHLVRRQAVATFYCMAGIVKLQAISRGRKIRQSDIGVEVQRRYILLKSQEDKLMNPEVKISAWMEKLSANCFICKRLSSSPNAMPLRSHYESANPNSAIMWLERWSASHFWRPAPQPKKPRDPKSRRRQGNGQLIDAQTGRPKRSVRRVPAANIESVSVQPVSGPEEPKGNLRKVPNHPADPPQENPQSELEKVKRNLRKIHNQALETSVQRESETEKPLQIVEKGLGPGPVILEQSKQDLENAASNGLDNQPLDHNVSKLSETMRNEMSLTVSKLPDVETSPEPVENNESFNFSSTDQGVDGPKVLMETTNHDDNIPLTNGNNRDLSPKDESTAKEKQKPSKKAYNPPKQEYVENNTQNTPKLPSYMAATESAKAKLRLQGSLRLGEDGTERNNVARRHSLPSAANSKLSSHSPRTQRQIHSGGKGGSKSDKSKSSKDGNGRAEWRR